MRRSMRWMLLGLAVVAACTEKAARELAEFRAMLAAYGYGEQVTLNQDGTVFDTDPANDIRFLRWTGSVPTTFMSERLFPSDFGGDPLFVGEGGAGLGFTANPPLTGDVDVEVRVGEWSGSGHDFELYGAFSYHSDGSIDMARGQEFRFEEDGDSWLKFRVGQDVSKILIYPLNAHLYGTAKSEDGTEDPQGLKPGDDVTVEHNLDINVSLSILLDTNLTVSFADPDWEIDDPMVPNREDFLVQSILRARNTRRFSCSHANATGPRIEGTLRTPTVKYGNTEISSPEDYFYRVSTRAMVLSALSRISHRGSDQLGRIRVGSFLQHPTLLLLVGGLDSVMLFEYQSFLLLRSFANFANTIGAVPLSTASQVAATQTDAVLFYGNTGYGISVYVPEIDGLGATQVDPSSGSVSDADNYAEDPSRAVLVQSSRNQVAFIEPQTLPSGVFFNPTGVLIRPNLFPAATGSVVTAARRNASSPVYFVTQGASSSDPGNLWRKNDPTDIVTPAVLVGGVGNSPRRIRFRGPIGAISNFDSNTLTLLVRDASDNVSIKGPVNVGDGPIGLDLLPLANGNYAILSTGFRGNTYTITVVEPDGDLVSNDTFPVPGGGLNPAHAVWADDVGTKIVVSCNGSDEVIVFTID